jgi:hypothetical protein
MSGRSKNISKKIAKGNADNGVSSMSLPSYLIVGPLFSG